MQNTLGQKQAEYIGKSVYYATISDLTKKIESNADSLQKVTTAVPSDVSLSSLVYFLQKKASEAGLVTKLVVFSKVTQASKDKKLKIVTMTVNVSGNYQGLKAFLLSLEKSSRLFEINAIRFNSPQPLSRPNQLQNQQQLYDFNLEMQTQVFETLN